MLRPQGYVQVVGDTSLERDTITCGHCNQIIMVKPGSAMTTYYIPQLYGPPVEEPGAACRQCMRAVCLRCHADGRCTPLELRIEAMESKNRMLRNILNA